MMTLRFTGEVPFKHVFVHGLVRDKHGQKMTKTKGNGLDPIDVIDGVTSDALVSKRTANLTQASLAENIARDTKRDFPTGIPAYGTDALRFTFSAIASPGQSSYPFDLQQVEGYHFFCNKLWNATKFVLANIEPGFRIVQGNESLADKWITSKLARTIHASRHALDRYRFDRYAQQLYQFAWHEYCDWYLELSKPVLFNEEKGSDSYVAAQSTLVLVLETLVRLLHPLTPYITETIWQRVAPLCEKTSESIMLAEYPANDDFQFDEDAERAVTWLQAIVSAIRNLRSARQIPPGNQVNIQISGHNESDREFASLTRVPLTRLAKVRTLELVDGEITPVGSTQVVGNLSITLPFENDAERHAETKRLQKEIDRLNSELERSLKKLNNENFVLRAPDDVVAKERDRRVTYESQLNTLQEQLNTIGTT